MKELYQALKNCYEFEHVVSINVEFDDSILALKKKSEKIQRMDIHYTQEGDTEIQLQGEHVVWLFDEEDIECAINLLENCNNLGCFYPSELLQIKV